ncbi:MAG: hypoxanthine phosphoribosyltransferase [Myxococcales bacterium]|nr:hypoxanthine phosphoribosyltransferase [Myxococcales bacterium]MDD9970063.1 hypoxanthine phosphoribosyltransferase [Myxococcales bacterium]
MTTEPTDVLISREALQQRVAALGRAITSEYAGRRPVIVVVLKGSFVFAADLIRAIELPLTVDFLGVRSYGDGTESSGVVQITADLSHSIEGRDVLIVEDIVDTGLTLRFLLDNLRTRGPRSLKLVALLHKPARSRVTVPIDYLGFTIDDVFVVGYGLDHAQRYRNLPELRVVSEHE